MPEELNRSSSITLQICASRQRVARPTSASRGIDETKILVTGNTVVEAVLRMLPDATERSLIVSRFGVSPDQFVLATIHRPENTDDRAVLAGLLAGQPA